MAWDDDMVTVLRVMVNDPDSRTYSDASLTGTLLVAALQVGLELRFAHDFRASVSDETITPDPTDAATEDQSYVNLVCLKAACIADRGAAILAAKQAIAVRDGNSAIDLRGVLQGKLKLLESGGWCAAYADAKFEYQRDSAGGVAGAAVMTPFRLYANGPGRGYFGGGDRSRDIF